MQTFGYGRHNSFWVVKRLETGYLKEVNGYDNCVKSKRRLRIVTENHGRMRTLFRVIHHYTLMPLNCRFLRDYVHNGCESQLHGNPIAVTSTDGYVVINVFSLVLNVSLRPIESSQ